jgi:nickel superoxide dismutase
MKKLMITGTAALMALTGAAFAHCEIPCGIYDDEARCMSLREHVKTIEKSMGQIKSLSAEADKNQLVRWVGNKEAHAGEIQHIVTQYFMTQRIKPPAGGDAAAQAKYAERLGLLHRMLVHAMKCKQTTDTAHTETLKSLIDDFDAAYFGKSKAAGSKGSHGKGSGAKGSDGKHQLHDHGSHDGHKH